LTVKLLEIGSLSHALLGNHYAEIYNYSKTGNGKGLENEVGTSLHT